MRIARAFVGFLALGFFALTGSALAQAPAPTLLIRGATLIDGLADAPLRDRSLLIEGNVIRDKINAHSNTTAPNARYVGTTRMISVCR